MKLQEDIDVNVTTKEVFIAVDHSLFHRISRGPLLNVRRECDCLWDKVRQKNRGG